MKLLGVNYKYKRFEELWYIDIYSYKIRRSTIYDQHMYYKEPDQARQLAVYILQKCKSPDTNFINKMIRNIDYSVYPNKTEGYLFNGEHSNIPVEFINSDEDEIINTTRIICEIFYRIHKIKPHLLNATENNIKNKFYMRYFK